MYWFANKLNLFENTRKNKQKNLWEISLETTLLQMECFTQSFFTCCIPRFTSDECFKQHIRFPISQQDHILIITYSTIINLYYPLWVMILRTVYSDTVHFFIDSISCQKIINQSVTSYQLHKPYVVRTL